MTIIFTAKTPIKEKEEEHRRNVSIVDFAHSANRKQRVYCNNHINPIVMSHDEIKKTYYCIGCGNLIHEGYGQSLMKKSKADIKYGIITDPYDNRNIQKHDGSRRTPLGFVLENPGLDTLETIRKKESTVYKSASEAARDTTEEWWLATH